MVGFNPNPVGMAVALVEEMVVLAPVMVAAVAVVPVVAAATAAVSTVKAPRRSLLAEAGTVG